MAIICSLEDLPNDKLLSEVLQKSRNRIAVQFGADSIHPPIKFNKAIYEFFSGRPLPFASPFLPANNPYTCFDLLQISDF